jgi:hypothetical protein
MTTRWIGDDGGIGKSARRYLVPFATVRPDREDQAGPDEFPPDGWSGNDNTIFEFVLPIFGARLFPDDQEADPWLTW